MATLETDSSQYLTPDIYAISSYVNEIKKRYTPDIDEETRMLGIFGYLGEVFSDQYQNSIVMASEFSNESIAIKAKFEKNIIAHALGLGYTDINAVPAEFDAALVFLEDDIINWLGARDADGNELGWGEDGFIFDKNIPIYIDDYCFLADYDIQIRKILLQNSGNNNSGSKRKFAYTARYLIDVENPISNVTNPYLPAPVRIKANGVNVIIVKVTLHQVVKNTVFKRVLSDNSISSKTLTFTFEGQMAAFNIDVTEGNTTTHLIPVYEGLNVEIRKYPYFYYTYLDANTIRIKFDRKSYAPRINSDVQINLWTTEGEGGNFTFAPDTYPAYAIESERYGYNNISCEIQPITGDSHYGINKKSIEELKKIIPREALSRGSITNLADLENWFNIKNNDDAKMYFYKKRDNALERLYYSFIVMRDSYNVIVPTNTIDIKISAQDLQQEENSGKYVFKRGQVIKFDGEFGTIYNPETDGNMEHGERFMYTIPYSFVINRGPLYGTYYLATMNVQKLLDFTYINEPCLYQYIATSINWYRGYTINPNTYEMTVSATQNISEDEEYAMVVKNEEDGTVIYNIRCIAVFYNEEGNPYRWAEGTVDSFENNTFNFKFRFTTEDYIDSENRIRIDTGLYDIGSTNESYGHLAANTKCTIHIVSKQGDYGLNGLDKIVPNFEEGYSLSNTYEVMYGVDFFYDFSEIVDSTVIVKLTEDSTGEYFHIKDVPVVREGYFDTEDKVMDFCSTLIERKAYIDEAIVVLEDNFGMDFKFFNTYGPSKLFTLDANEWYINRTNINLTFRLKFRPNYDTNIINDIIDDIKTYVENIDEISSVHMPNLITLITNTYRDYLVYFEFVDMNGYGPSIQHLYAMDMPKSIIVPEFINISTLPDGTPDITLMVE